MAKRSEFQGSVELVRDLIARIGTSAMSLPKATQSGFGGIGPRKATRASRSGSAAPKDERATAIHSLRSAKNKFREIVGCAIAGEPQAITNGRTGAVVVLSLDAARRLLAQGERPRSFADLFPVDKENPPVTRLIVKSRPGRHKVRF